MSPRNRTTGWPGLQRLYGLQLEGLLRLRWLVLAGFLAAVGFTASVAANMGREFMPELEEGSILVRGVFPINIAMDEVVDRALQARRLLQKFARSERYPYNHRQAE